MNSSRKSTPGIAIRKIKDLLGLDLRSLALFRICLATTILIDLIVRLSDLKAHYTDFGLLPRGPLIEKFLHPWLWSLHLLSGQALFQVGLFIVAGIAALVLLVGYRTRWATILSWVLLVSLQNRNPMILNSGDIVLRLLLFWGMFLPLGAFYSVDSALNSAKRKFPKQFLSGATIALTLQICFIYWFAAIFKANSVWLEGDAVYYALSLDQFATPLGQYLLNFPVLLSFLSVSTVWLEAIGPCFLFIPVFTGFFRFGTVVTFILLHLGFGATLTLGNFPLICITGWLSLLPRCYWQWMAARLDISRQKKVRIYYDRDCGFCLKMVVLIKTFFLLPLVTIHPAQSEPTVLSAMQTHNSWVVTDPNGAQHYKFAAVIYLCRLSPLLWVIVPLLERRAIANRGTKVYEWVAANRPLAGKLTQGLRFKPLRVRSDWRLNLICLWLLIYVVFWNLHTLPPKWVRLPQSSQNIGRALGLDQRWSMFAPSPTKDDGWYVIPGRLKDGTKVNVLQADQPVRWDKPKALSFSYANRHWRKYMENIWLRKNAAHRRYYGKYLCRKWNTQHQGNQQLDTFEIHFMLEKTLPDYQQSVPEKKTIWRHSCFKKD